MVNPISNRRGKGTLGCIVPIVLIALFIYAGSLFGRPWFRAQQFRDEMTTTARFAASLSDSLIRVRLEARADSLKLPGAARRSLRIRRIANPDRVVITSKWVDSISIPVVGIKVLNWDMKAEEPL